MKTRYASCVAFVFRLVLVLNSSKKRFEAMMALTPLLDKISVERTFVEFDKLLLAPYWRVGLSSMIESQAYDYLPDMAGSQDKLQSLFDLEDHFTFESSEQAWAALLWVLKVEDAQKFFKTLEDITTICQTGTGFARSFGSSREGKLGQA